MRIKDTILIKRLKPEFNSNGKIPIYQMYSIDLNDGYSSSKKSRHNELDTW